MIKFLAIKKMTAPFTTPTWVPLLLKILPLMTDLQERPRNQVALVGRRWRDNSGATPDTLGIQTIVAKSQRRQFSPDALIRP
jgi:hypothetical protein